MIIRFKRIFETINDHADEVSYPYRVFGIFCVITYPLYYLLWYYTDPTGYESIFLRLIVVVLSVPLILKNYWPQSVKKFISIYFYLVFLYALPFLFTFLLLENQFSTVSVFNSLSIFVLCVLILDLRALFIIVPIGIMLGFLVYHGLTGIWIKSQADYQLLVIMYLSIFTNCIIFARVKEYIQKEKIESMKFLTQILIHELRTPLRAISLAASNMKDYLPKLIVGYQAAWQHKLDIPEISSTDLGWVLPIFDSIEQEAQAVFTFMHLVWMNVSQPKLSEKKLEKLSMAHCIDLCLQRYPLHENERSFISVNLKNNFEFIGDEEIMIHILFNLLKNSLYYVRAAEHPKIEIWFEQTERKNLLYFKDNGQGIAKKVLPHIFDRFYSKTLHGMGIGLSFCKDMMKALGGSIKCRSKEGGYTEFVLSFPRVRLK